jgi:hypothetical protein
VKYAAVLAIAACRRDPIASCDDDLRGVYLAASERWMVLDHGATLEAYPLFPDVPGGATGDAVLEVAPRVIDFERGPGADPIDPTGAFAPLGETRRQRRQGPQPHDFASLIEGTLRRRYMRGRELCEARAPVHVTRCANDTLELVLVDPAPPIAFAPCTWPGPGPSHVVHWQRE